MNIAKKFNLDVKTVELMGKNHGKEIEKAVLEYAKNPAENPVIERLKLPLSHGLHNVCITMDSSTYDLLDKLADGKRVVSTMIEVAIWRHWK